jgi:hypothetical protein
MPPPPDIDALSPPDLKSLVLEAADDLRGGEQIDAIFRAAERENVADARGSRREFAAA